VTTVVRAIPNAVGLVVRGRDGGLGRRTSCPGNPQRVVAVPDGP
jgi:hypothetical protein